MFGGDFADPFGLIESLRRIRSDVVERHAGHDPLDALVRVCVDTVPAADAVALSRSGAGTVRSSHWTDPAVAEMDHRHCELERGPLLEAALAPSSSRSVTIVDEVVFDVDVADGPTVELSPPFRALHSTTLRSHDGHRVALDLYAREPFAFGPETTVLADMFAIHATNLIYGRPDTAAARDRRIVETIARRLGIRPADARTRLESSLPRTIPDLPV